MRLDERNISAPALCLYLSYISIWIQSNVTSKNVYPLTLYGKHHQMLHVTKFQFDTEVEPVALPPKK